MSFAEITPKNQAIKNCDLDCRGECCQGVVTGGKEGDSKTDGTPNPHRFFSQSAQKFNQVYVQGGFFSHRRLKPSLTPVEKELLHELLQILKLDLNEFKLKLQDLKINLKDFTRSLKENLIALGMPSPKHLSVFFPKLLERNLLPERLLEKLLLEKENLYKPHSPFQTPTLRRGKQFF